MALSLDPLPGWTREARTRRPGIYYFDRFGNLELLYRDAGIRRRTRSRSPRGPRPPVMPARRDPALGDEGELVLTDVSRSHFPLPAGRPIRSLRIFQVLPKDHAAANQPRIGHANAEGGADAAGHRAGRGRRLGLLPRAGPQAALLPSGGRRRAGRCRACEAWSISSRASAARAWAATSAGGPRRRPAAGWPAGRPSIIAPGRTARGRSAIRGSSSRCSTGIASAATTDDGEADAAAGVDRRGPRGPPVRYNCRLRPYLRWYEWGGESISQIVTRPGRIKGPMKAACCPSWPIGGTRAKSALGRPEPAVRVADPTCPSTAPIGRGTNSAARSRTVPPAAIAIAPLRRPSVGWHAFTMHSIG